MCGFSGIISTSEISFQAITNSLQAIKHRGPDDTLIVDGNAQFYATDISSASSRTRYPAISTKSQSTLFLGFNRLSIVDLSDAAMQPFYDKNSGNIFVLNGEIYNYKQLRSEYLAQETCLSESDSEVAFKLFLTMGNAFVHLLRGMFVIVVYNIHNQQLTVWRDRLGIKPFYYAFDKNRFVFSSEIKGIHATGIVKNEIDSRGLAYSMYLTTSPAPITLYKNIHALQAAHTLSFSIADGKLRIEPYWKLAYQPAKSIRFDEFHADVLELANLHKTGDVPKALMLSGGIDSGLLAWYMGKADAQTACLNLYTENHSTDERHFAKCNARNARLPLHCFEVPALPDDDLRNRLLTSEEEPNCMPEPAFFLSMLAARQGYKVVYNALGPDEIFGGYNYYRQAFYLNKINRFVPLIPGAFVPKRLRPKLNELKLYGLAFLPVIVRQLFSWDEIANYFSEKKLQLPEHPLQFLKNQIDTLQPAFNKFPNMKKVSYVDIFYYISSHHTFRTDQPSMHWSVEMRFPFLDHHFVQKYFNQPELFNHLHRDLKPKLKEYARNILDEEVLSMPKRGFSMPVHAWSKSKSAKKLKTKNEDEKQWYLEMLEQLESALQSNKY